MSRLKTSASAKFSGVSVIFDWGLQDRGEVTSLYSQADVVDGYGYRLQEELEYENIRTQHVDTRKAPVRTEIQRLAEVPPGFIPVFLSCDWHPRARRVNASVVEFSGDSLYKLADAICFSLTQWGQCFVGGHAVLRPVAVESDSEFVRIKPFSLNGPKAEDYLRSLTQLGEDLGRAIGGYLAELGEGLRR